MKKLIGLGRAVACAAAQRPVGLTVNAPANVWIVATTLPGDNPGMKLIFR